MSESLLANFMLDTLSFKHVLASAFAFGCLSVLIALLIRTFHSPKDFNTSLKACGIAPETKRGGQASKGKAFLTIFNDYWNYRFYLPFGLGERGLVKVQDKKCYQELSESTQLSQRAVYADLFSLKQTLHGFDGEEQKTARTRLFGRVLQVQGPGRLLGLSSLIETSVRNSFDSALKSSLGGTDSVSVNLAELCEDSVFEVFLIYFFGPVIAGEAEFRKAAKQHPRDLVNTLIVAKLVPKALSPYTAYPHPRIDSPDSEYRWIVNRITHGGTAGDTMRARLVEIVGGKKSWDEDTTYKQSTMLHSMIESTKDDDYWSAESLSTAIMGIWLAASFQPWVNLHFIILKLCECPEYIEILRDEVRDSQVSLAQIEDLPVLDSFFKEVFRTRPLDHLSVRRKALRPFKFSNGQAVPVGQVACIPAIQRMQDPSAYHEPLEFRIKRFVCAGEGQRKTKSPKNSRLTDVSEDFLSWGFGSLA